MILKTPLISELKTRRQALGLSMTEVGARCGISEKTLTDWEQGIGSPQLDAVEHWAGAIGLKVAFATAESEAKHGLKVDWGNRRVAVDGAPIRLTPMEWKALERLAWAPGELVTHQELFRHLYGSDRHYRAQSTAVRVLITKLRRLLPLRIEAQWRRGYVISGLEPSRPSKGTDDDTVGDERTETPKAEAPTPREPTPFVAKTEPRNLPPIRSGVLDLSASTIRPFPSPAAAKLGLCRSEELGVIERYLAERGATRCPDVATIQHSPLPTLVWDKIKRKWVRPALTGREAS